MGDTGDRLGYDLYYLSVVANHDFPTVAADIHHARQALSATVGGEGVFNRPFEFDGGGVGPAMTAWMDLRESIIHVLSQTASNLDDTSTALNLAINQYRATDEGARSRMDSLMHERGNPHPGTPA